MIKNNILIILSFFWLVNIVSCGSSSSGTTGNQSAIQAEEGSALSLTQVPSSKSDDFSGDGALLNFITNNESDLPDISRVGGRYRANLTDNTSDMTLHFNNMQGRLDAKRLSFPFEFIARNIGIGTQADSQAPRRENGSVIFAGVQVHVLDLNSRNSSHIVVGHRGGTQFTIEGKNTVDGVSSVDDMGADIAPDGRADIRVVGHSDKTISIYWQLPNQVNDNWQLYNGYDSGNGRLPGVAPIYDADVYVGLITYAQNTADIPFVGTCDAIEIYESQ